MIHPFSRHPFLVILLLTHMSTVNLVSESSSSVLYSAPDNPAAQDSLQLMQAETTGTSRSWSDICLDIIRVDKWTEERKYRVLSTLFDGVPLPSSMQPIQIIPMDSLPQPGMDTTTIILETQKPLADALFTHKPYAEKRCFECHDLDSGSKYGSDVGTLCYTCHQDYSDLPGFVHGPVSIGLCQGCHNPHSSKFANLLSRDGDDLCTFCHDTIDRDNPESHKSPIDQACLACHSPHNSMNDVLLVAENSTP